MDKSRPDKEDNMTGIQEGANILPVASMVPDL
jgi:hypothetical protein